MRALVCLALLVLAFPLSAQNKSGSAQGHALLSQSAAASVSSSKVSMQFEADHEFDRGSRITVERLSEVQIDNLVMLGRVWGFLKYHHPAIASGQRQWDYDLFRVLPEILSAESHASANAALVRWIDGLGPIPLCNPCAKLNEDYLEFGPDLEWIGDTGMLGRPLSERLQAVYANRPMGAQFYVSLAPHVLNPLFDRELPFSDLTFPDAGFQLLALYRFWNILQYWSPNRLVAGENWPAVLHEFIPRVMLAKNKDEYQLAMLALIVKVHDSHTNLRSGLKVRPPVGDCSLPVNLRFVEGKLIVTSYASTTLGPASGLEPGDVLEQIDGRKVEELTRELAPLYAGSNEAARMRDMAHSITNGSCGTARIAVDRADGARTIESARVPIANLNAISHTDDLAGPTFRLLSKDVAYLKLSSIKASDVTQDIEAAKGTKGLIIDIRNYPSEFVVFALGSHLVDRYTSFARVTNADLANPGAFHWGGTLGLLPAEPHYDGKIVILVDEVSQSQAEYTAMAFRAAPNAIVLGSMTAGADGNVSMIALPGGLRTAISGIGVFYPDGRPTQRVGIVPDVEVKPTIEGIRTGRDEVLEAAIRRIVADKVPAADLDEMTRH